MLLLPFTAETAAAAAAAAAAVTLLPADRYFYYYNTGLQQHYVLYSQPGLGAEATMLLDPNTLSADGTVSLSVSGWVCIALHCCWTPTRCPLMALSHCVTKWVGGWV